MAAACRGLQDASTTDLLKCAFRFLQTAPLRWVVILYKRLQRLAIVFGVWWFARVPLAELGAPVLVVLLLATFVVLCRPIYDELRALTLHVFVIASGGRLVRWLCDAYLSCEAAREFISTRPAFRRLIVVMTEAMPKVRREEYEEFVKRGRSARDSEAALPLNELT